MDLGGPAGPAGSQSRRLVAGSALSAVGDSPGSVALHRVASASCTTALTCLSTNQKAARRLQSCCNCLTSSHLLTGNHAECRKSPRFSLHESDTHTHLLSFLFVSFSSWTLRKHFSVHRSSKINLVVVPTFCVVLEPPPAVEQT